MAGKRSDAYVAIKKKSGRYAVKKRGGGFLRGPEKAQWLAGQGLTKLTAPQPKPAEPAAEASDGGAAE